MQQPSYQGQMEEDSTISALYQRYAPGLFTYLRLHVHSREDAEDLLVDTFLGACESSSFSSLSHDRQRLWLWRVMRNKVADYYRSPAHRLQTNVDDLADTIYVDEMDAPEQIAERGEEYLQLHTQLQKLPPLQQQLLRLRFVNGLTSTEIARAVGKSDVAVRMMLSRTLNMLRSIYPKK
jgi:RNA polymerase sigma factor (sigma-70 family)